MKKTHDLMATVGSFKNQAGEEKKRYVKCGVAFTDDQGRISLKLDAAPVSPEWSGFINLWEPRDSDSWPQEQRRAAASIGEGQDSGMRANGQENGNDEDIPF